MFISQLFEGEIKRVIVIYPGRFQPFHLGHKEVFATLQAKFGTNNVFIGTSNKTDAVKSPFNFSDKQQLMTAAGVNSHHVIEVTSPYMPDDYIRAIGFDPKQTVLIFAVGAPDLKRLEVDAKYTELTPTGKPSKIPVGKSVGDPKPFKTFRSLQDSETADQHQYVLIVNERQKKVTVNGKDFDASHGTQVRALWNAVRNDPKASTQVLQQLYGRATPELAHIFNKIPATTESVIEDAAGVGVVKNSKDPRYVMATTGNQNDVDGKTLGKMMKAYHLIGKNPANTKQTPVTEAKSLHKRVKIVRGPDAGKYGWIREIKHGAFKGAEKRYYVDIEGGGQANNLSGPDLRIANDQQGVAEGAIEEGVNDPHIFKCIFLFGPMGAGKSTVARPLLTHTGLRSVNLDNFNELFVKKGQVPTGHLSPDQLEKSWQLTQTQQQNFIDGRLGVIIDGSGRNPETAIGVIEKLMPLGYEFMMIFVNVSEATSIARQQSRAEKQKQQWGAGRQVDPELAKNTYAQVQKNLGRYSAYFGPQRFVYVDNENTPDLTQATKKVEAFLRAPVRQPAAIEWIQSQKGGQQVSQQQQKLATAQTRQQQALKQYNPLNPKFAKQGVAEGLGLYGPFTVTINTGERPQSRTKTKKFRREDDAILWAEDWLEDAPQYVFATAQVTDPEGNVVWTTDEQGVAEALRPGFTHRDAGVAQDRREKTLANNPRIAAEVERRRKAAEEEKKKQQGAVSENQNPYGYKVGQTVKLHTGGQGRVIDIFDDSIEVLLPGGRTVTVAFQDANVLDEQGMAEGAEQMTPNWAKYVLDQIYNSDGAVTLTDLFDEGIPGLYDMFMDTAKKHGFDPEEDFEDVQHELTLELEDFIKGGHDLDEAQTDYQKRRQRERDVDAGKPVSRQPKNPQNDYFARRKKEKEQGVTEGTADDINKMFSNMYDPMYGNLQRVALLAMQGRQSEASAQLNRALQGVKEPARQHVINAVNNIKPVTINGKIADSSTLDKSSQHKDWILKTFIPWVEKTIGKGVAEGSFRDDEFRNRERNAGLENETNNIAIAINGKTWKVIPGKGYADSPEERSYLNNMKNWAEKKSAASGKKWTVHLTGASITESSLSGQDTVSMDIPFLIRALEYAKEDAKTDLDLHNAVERMLDAAKAGNPLRMADYDAVFSKAGMMETIVKMGKKTPAPAQYFKPMGESAEQLNVGDQVIVSGNVQYRGTTGIVVDFGQLKRFVVVDLYNHGKHSFHSSDVSLNDYAGSEEEESDHYNRDPDARKWAHNRDMEEGMYQYNAQDPYNSEFAPDVGMGRMTLRGWKQSLARRVAELAKQLSQASDAPNVDNAALWDNVYKKLQAQNLDPIAQEIEQAHQELEKIRQRGGIRSRAFKR